MKMTYYYHLICHFYYIFSLPDLKSYPFGHDVLEEARQLLLIVSLYSCYAAFFCLFLILSIIKMAFAVCIPKKIHRISVFLFRALTFDSE